MFSRFVTLSALTLVTTSPAFAEEAPTAEKPGEEPSAEPSAEPSEGDATETPEDAASAESTAPEKIKPIRVVKTALQRYTLGEGDAALGDIRATIADCGEPEAGQCSNREVGALYVTAGILIASDPQQHSAAVAAFRRGLAYDSLLAIPKTYETSQVMAAFEEAKGKPTAPAPAAAPASPPAQPATPTAADSQWGNGEQYSGTYVFLGVTPMFGFGTGGASGPALFRTNVGLSILGAPGRSRVLLGVRPHFGVNQRDPVTEGFLGSSFVVGGMLGRPEGRDFNYLTVATGFEYYPAVDIAVSTSQLRIGRKLGAFSLAWAMDAVWIPGSHFIFFGGELALGGGTG